MDIKSVPPALIAPMPVGVDSALKSPSVEGADAGASFADSLTAAVQDANAKSQAADHAVQALMVGEGSLHQTMIAMQDASVAMEMVLAVRNKALEAYQEIMRMPV